MFSSVNKTFGCCSKIFGCSYKNLFVVPNFVAVTKPFFPWRTSDLVQFHLRKKSGYAPKGVYRSYPEGRLSIYYPFVHEWQRISLSSTPTYLASSFKYTLVKRAEEKTSAFSWKTFLWLQLRSLTNPALSGVSRPHCVSCSIFTWLLIPSDEIHSFRKEIRL